MDSLSLGQIADWIGVELTAQSSISIQRVMTDSRKIQPGDLFVALSGDRYDGHSFLEDVAARGASAAIVRRAYGQRPHGFPTLEVDDTLYGLQQLAGSYRKTLPAKIVGITGSNGKTSTKEFTFSVLSSKKKTWCTEGNLNNHIGVPLTLLEGNSGYETGVVEMGMNHAGEIAPLAKMAAPEVGIITNVGVAHIEYLGSRRAIAEEKGALAQAVSSRGTVVLNAEDEFCEMIAGMTNSHILTAGIGCGDIQALDLMAEEEGTRFGLAHEGERVEVFLPIPGRHMVRNAAMAAAAGLALDLTLHDVAEGFQSLKKMHGRLESRIVAGVRFLDDSYNANPDSMEAALATLGQWPARGRRIAVLGRMGELGGFAEEGHRKVGAVAAVSGLDWLLTIGEEAEWISEEARKRGAQRVDHFDDVVSAAKAIREEIHEDDLVLIKGSRSAAMERVIEEVGRI